MEDLFDEIRAGHAHAHLVEKARAWLMGAGNCVVAATEVSTWVNMEIPDAIGFDYRGNCTIVECKTSRSDFLADKNKKFRKMPQLGMGMNRYFMVPRGLVSLTELPAGWGLIFVYPNTVRRVKNSRRFDDRNIHAERRCMVKLMRNGKYESKTLS